MPAIANAAEQLARATSMQVLPCANIADQVVKSMNRQLFPYANIADQIVKSMNRQLFPYANIGDQIAKSMNRQLLPYVNVVDQLTKSVNSQLFPYFNVLGKPLDALLDHLAFVCEARKKGCILDENGWFPHYTIPDEFFSKDDEGESFNAQLLTYYRENWEETRATIERNLSGYQVDDETKAAFLEALTLHKMGFYLSVCRNLIPEIERVVRIELFGNSIGIINVGDLIFSSFKTLPRSRFPDHDFWFAGFDQLTGYMYKSVWNDIDRLQVADFEIPNRHASQHGLVAYSSEQNSLNSIFIAEYVMQLITAGKLLDRNVALGT